MATGAAPRGAEAPAAGAVGVVTAAVLAALLGGALDGALADLETRHCEQLLRIHRNALVLRAALRGLEKYDDPEEGEGWGLRLQGIPELLPVSRRQLALVKIELKDGA